MERVSARECAKKGGVGVLPQKFLDFTYTVRLILTQCGHFYNVMPCISCYNIHIFYITRITSKLTLLLNKICNDALEVTV